MKKNTDKQEARAQLIVSAIIAIILFLFTYYGFFESQICHSIDKDSLFCRLHPFTGWDLLGCILFYTGALFLAGVPRFFGYDPYLDKGNWQTWAVAIGTLAGIVIIWAV